MNQKKIGSFIASLRKEKAYTQKQVAERLGLSEKTISKWECGKGLPEVSFMEPLCNLLGISVNELLIGERLPIFEILKKMDDTRIELFKQIEFEQLKLRVYKLYGIEAESMAISGYGAGSLTYFISVKDKKYVVKYASENDMNHPENEPEVCAHLRKRGIPVCDFVPNLQGNIISVDENGRQFHLQHFIDGVTYDYNHSPKWLMRESAKMLAQIHNCMKDIDNLPVGIGEDFFRYRTPDSTLNSYKITIQKAIDSGDVQSTDEIRSNMEILSRFPEYKFDINKFTCKNTHGDFIITQLICGENKINGVIDWTTACVHPVVWEIMRSYVFASPLCADGEIDIEDFTGYVREYLINGGELNSYDLENMGKMFFYFLSVCDFYGQYYDSLTRNKSVYLQQARLSSKLMKWLDKNIGELEQALGKIEL